MDWVFVLIIVGAIWAVVALSWRRGEGEGGPVPRTAMVQAGAVQRAPTAPLIYGYGEDDARGLGEPPRSRWSDQRNASERSGAFTPPPIHQTSEDQFSETSLSEKGVEPSAAQSSDGQPSEVQSVPSGPLATAMLAPAEPLDTRTSVPMVRPSSAEIRPSPLPLLPVLISDYQPGEQVVIQYEPTHAAAPSPELSAHQVGADVEIRLSGTTVAILQGQLAGELISKNLLHLQREELHEPA